jgi:hypothetical protein
MTEDSIVLKLSRAQALVLVDWLIVFDDSDAAPPLDSAERRVLWRIEGRLHQLMGELFAPNYRELLENARARVIETYNNDAQPDDD